MPVENLSPSSFNSSSINPSAFILIGIPGLQEIHLWISIPLCSMYILTLAGNCTILFIITREENLHKPMYLFLSMLSIIDLIASSSTMPKILCLFWFNSREINFDACLVQMFFIHSFSIMESTVLLAMAFDRYIAICNPLRYKTLLTNSRIAKIGVIAIIRGTVLMTPCPFLIKKLSFCRTNVISHTYCEHMAIVKIACTDTTINRVYGLFVALVVIGLDVLFIALSYIMIVRAVLRLSSNDARVKAFGTCGSHICVILISYVPALFSFFTHRFGHNIAPQVHIILANIYLFIPPMVNPIVYGVKTKEIRHRVLRIVYQKR
ncbi:putative olfactory receptor 52P1 isoform X1 [Microcaecilia unicolor]|uniref:Olfactory receptor n=1 Tax=Microcaecilia unicolor TaxID=1415580 RepID=A0A6P7XZ77_9AMPH|nr:putative olfactory receptor 52P1 isoform X1 [Microcaecilia unicolor]